MRNFISDQYSITERHVEILLTGILLISESASTAARVPGVAHNITSHEAIVMPGNRIFNRRLTKEKKNFKEDKTGLIELLPVIAK